MQLTLSRSVESKVPFRDVFQTDAAFHELLASLSQNSFVLPAIRRQNRLRRLLEYRSNLDASRVRAWSLEHIAVIDALLAGNRQLASAHLRTHLENARANFGARLRVVRGGTP
jgi:DNA-binding GntR family transcriptional regulator